MLIHNKWNPIIATEENDVCKIAVWGREYTVDQNCLPSSIVSQKEELLAAPI